MPRDFEHFEGQNRDEHVSSVVVVARGEMQHGPAG
jgi:hypothetical protein